MVSGGMEWEGEKGKGEFVRIEKMKYYFWKKNKYLGK